MNCIAVTGASGFIGRSLVLHLIKQGFHVVAITGSSSYIEHSAYHYCPDYSNISLLADLVSGCDSIIHLAARAHRISHDSDCETLDIYRAANVSTLVSVAKAAQKSSVKRVVFVSSIGVNGSFTHGTPFTEADIPAPVDSYAISKLEAEQYLIDELADGSTDWVVLRPPLVYGPGCPGNLSNLIRLASTAPFLPFGALHAGRTLICIDNLLDALQIAAYHPAVSRCTFLISDDQDIDVAGILQAFLQGLGRQPWRLFPFPPTLLGFFFQCIRMKPIWQKISGELLVDSSAFSQATGWVPVVKPYVGLCNAAASYAAL